MQKQQALFVVIACGLGLLQACTQESNPAQVQADVTKAEAAGQKAIVDAQAKLDQVVATNNKDLVDVQADAQKDAATAPNAPPPAASADVTKAHNNAAIAVADAQYGVDKTKAEAAKSVADAKCEADVGDAQNACKATAKAAYDSALAAAKAKNDAEHASHQ